MTNVFELPEYACKNKKSTPLDDRKADNIERQRGLLYSLDRMVKATRLSHGWIVQPDAPHSGDEAISQRKHCVHLHTIKIESLMPGDMMAIPIPQEQAIYRFLVTEVSKTSMGYLTWKGYLEDFPNNNEVILTRGMDLTFASINTPKNAYQLQAFESEGWIKTDSRLRR